MQAAVDFAEERNIGTNDALAIIEMRKRKQTEIYTFNMHFDTIKI